MAKLLEKPEELRVSTNIQGVPLNLFRNGKVERVTKVYQRWHTTDLLWGHESSKDYFRVKTSSGLVCDIYRDIIANSWYLGRIHS